MTAVYFVPSQLARTTTREEWYHIWQSTRRLRNDVRRSNEMKTALLSQDIPQVIKDKIMEEMINPPILLAPGMFP